MQQEHKYIYQVYKAGSFSKAARDLFMTQPALSIAVQKIETALGQQLFDRSCHPLALTEAGKIYIAAIAKAKELERYPKIKVELLEGSSAQVLGELADRELDIAFSCDSALIDSFPHERGFNDSILLAVNEKCAVNKQLAPNALTAEDIKKGRHLDDACHSTELEWFGDIDFILLTQGNNLYERSLAMLAQAGVRPAIKMQVSQLVTAYHLVEQFPAAAFISSRLVTHTDTQLKFYKLAYPEAVRQFALLLPKREYVSLIVRRFIELFQQIENV